MKQRNFYIQFDWLNLRVQFEGIFFKFLASFLGDVLVAKILDVFKLYGLSEQEVKQHVLFVTDRGANIKYGLIRNGFRRLTCYAHIIHNLVCRMFTCEDVKRVISYAAKLTAYFKLCGFNRRIPTSLKLYTSTRWNSVYIMLNEIIKNYRAIYDILVEKQQAVNENNRKSAPETKVIDMITCLKLDELVEIRDFLEPFKVMFQV